MNRRSFLSKTLQSVGAAIAFNYCPTILESIVVEEESLRIAPGFSYEEVNGHLQGYILYFDPNDLPDKTGTFDVTPDIPIDRITTYMQEDGTKVLVIPYKIDGGITCEMITHD